MAISSAGMPCHGRCLQKASVKLLIAYRCHYDPTYLAARELLRSGALARSRPSKAPSLRSRPNLWRLTRRLGGGGPLMMLVSIA